MPITIRPSLSPDREVDVTSAVTAAVAYELWRHCGGNAVVNWLEAERIVAKLGGRHARRASAVGGRRAAEQEGAARRRRQEFERIPGPIPLL